MLTSLDPPLIAISIHPERHSHILIEETKEFVVNVPTMQILKETLFCGRTSGKDHDKFRETGLTPLPSRKVQPPVIKECVAHLECKLYSQFTTGDHIVFIGEIVEAYVNKEVFERSYNLKKSDYFPYRRKQFRRA